jgi:XTP/dITP diphosphohydrolase
MIPAPKPPSTPLTPGTNSRSAQLEAFDKLLTVMDELRTNCPWDKKQTFESLAHLTIEETYELTEAISSGNPTELRNEAGDLFLHLVFYARIASETNLWDTADMIYALIDKLIRRHPHIYSDVQATTEEEVKRNWEQIKLAEKAPNSATPTNVSTSSKGVLDGVPKALPALIKAQRIQEKARGVGFDWANPTQVWAKVQEELEELSHETSVPDLVANQQKIEAEFGDLLFSLVNYARFIGVNPEQALERTNSKFMSRFSYIEKEASGQNRPVQDLSLNEMEALWQQAKRIPKITPE